MICLRWSNVAFITLYRWKGFRNVLQKHTVNIHSGKLELLLHDRIQSISQRLFFLAQIYNGTILHGDAGENRTESCESTLSIQTTGERHNSARLLYILFTIILALNGLYYQLYKLMDFTSISILVLDVNLFLKKIVLSHHCLICESIKISCLLVTISLSLAFWAHCQLPNLIFCYFLTWPSSWAKFIGR